MATSAVPRWTCPKCGFLVGKRTPQRLLPQGGGLYYCPICHLELAFDAKGESLPHSETAPDKKPRSRS